MDILKLYQKRHSCRSFDGRKIDIETVKDLIEKARLAPSACNSQPWRVIITADDEENAKMEKALTDYGKNPYLKDASAFVAVFDGEAKLKPGSERKFKNDKFVKYDIGQFVAYLTLYAESVGISSIVIGWVNNDTLAESFDTRGLNCSLVVALGYSAEASIPEKNRKSLDEILM